MYILLCRKDSGMCRQMRPTYVGECGDGPNSSFTHRVSKHLGTTSNNSQSDTETQARRHFRLPEHSPNSDLNMILIEKIKVHFDRKSKSFTSKKFKSLKLRDISEIEHGLNLSAGQTYEPYIVHTS